jgi:hypothetical protein
MAYAFRCKNCNSLAEASHAGERALPAKCSTCGAGVSFTPDGIKTYDEDNWVALADLSPADLKPILTYHAISADEIEAHEPVAGGVAEREPTHIHADVAEGAGADEVLA